jgi:cytochrome c oxidase cbb3-type subunit 3
MADFLHSGWGLYVAILTVVSILFCLWLALTMARGRMPGETVGTTGHSWDEDLQELNNPLPRWWLWLFIITIVFSIGYLWLYPGLGARTGFLGWSQTEQYEREVKRFNAVTDPLFARFLAMDLKKVAADSQGRAIGERLYQTYCVQCHGADARGSKGYPNLTDNDWLWGGEPSLIKTTILEGRHGMMPAMAAAVGTAAEVEQLAHYVVSLSGGGHDSTQAALGKGRFEVCATCHGTDGRGNAALGAPNLTDRIWLYGGGVSSVLEAISKGRAGIMPAFKDSLGEGKVHVLAAYVWGLSNSPATASEQ